MAAKKRKQVQSKLNRRYHQANKRSKGGGLLGDKQDGSRNPFEYKHQRNKFQIVGKHKESKTQKVSIRQDKNIKKREQTLLVEYRRRGTANSFLDKRFGEQDENLNEEDKAILRFQRERLRQAKEGRFALADEDDGAGDNDNDHLTHLGRDVDDIDDFHRSDGDMSSDDDLGFRPKKSADFPDLLTEFQFGGDDREDEDGAQRKSKKEVMQEIIAKSKYYKGLKAKEKDEDEDLRQKLDADFHDMMRDNETSSALMRLQRKKEMAPHRRPEADYDRIAEDLIFEFKRTGAQALPTKEEVARKAKQQLVVLEQERLKANAIDDSEVVGDDLATDMKGYKGRRMRQKLEVEGNQESGSLKVKARAETGDDLGDDFELDEDEQYNGDLGEGSDAEGSGGEESEGYSSYSEEDSSEELSEGQADALDEPKKVNLAGEKKEAHSDSKSKKSHITENNLALEKKASKDKFEKLAYIIPAPTGYRSFLDLISPFSPEQQVEILQRIRLSNAVSLKPENRRNMQVFYGILLQHFFKEAGRNPFPAKVLNLFIPEIHMLSSEIPLFAANAARARMEQMSSHLLKGSWPTRSMLATLQLYTRIFDTKDLRHPVITPTLLLIGKWLIFTPIQCAADIAKALALCRIVYDIVKDSNKFLPEVLIFLKALIAKANVKDVDKEELEEDFAFDIMLPKGKVDQGEHQIDLIYKYDDENEYFKRDTFKLGALSSAFTLVSKLFDIYESLPSAPELFKQLVETMHDLASKLSGTTRGKKMLVLTKSLEKRLSTVLLLREPLGDLLKAPVKAVKQFNPRFEDDFTKGKDYDLDRDRAERKRLQRDLKKERRGAVRELRKDNRFLSSIKNREERQQKADVQSKYNQMFQFLQHQEDDFRSGGQRGMANLKKKKL